MMRKFLLFVSIFFLLSACKQEETHDVQYYMDHPKERKEKTAECRNNVGEKAETPNCKNAMMAEFKALHSGTAMPSIRR